MYYVSHYTYFSCFKDWWQKLDQTCVPGFPNGKASKRSPMVEMNHCFYWVNILYNHSREVVLCLVSLTIGKRLTLGRSQSHHHWEFTYFLQTKSRLLSKMNWLQSQSIPATGQPFDFDPIKFDIVRKLSAFLKQKMKPSRITVYLACSWYYPINFSLSNGALGISRQMTSVRNETVAVPDWYFLEYKQCIEKYQQLKLALTTTFLHQTLTNSHRPTRVTRIPSWK